MRTADLDFELPPELIATTPAEPRDSARLMVVHRDTGRVEHRRVMDLPTLGVFQPGDLMVVNQTRVLPAYLTGLRTSTGGHITGLFVHPLDTKTWHVMLQSKGKLQPGETIDLIHPPDPTPLARLTLMRKHDRGAWDATITADGPTDPPTLLGRVGQTPLPPYIRKARRVRLEPEFSDDDGPRYNTVFAEPPPPPEVHLTPFRIIPGEGLAIPGAGKFPGELPGAFPGAGAGSVAAPTAGLHFTPRLLWALDRIGVRRAVVTLHIGMGTFLPVQTDTLEAHPIHKEWIDVPPETIRALAETRKAERRILAVGTTTVRSIESLPREPTDHFRGKTDLFITPDRVADGSFAYRYTDRLLTNFHLPRSTLLALVAALPGVGVEQLLDWYRRAIAEKYRFYSFGDAMLIL